MKKILSLLVVAMLLLTTMPAVAFGDITEGNEGTYDASVIDLSIEGVDDAVITDKTDVTTEVSDQEKAIDSTVLEVNTEDDNTTEIETTTSNNNISGIAGDNITWKLDLSTGELSLSGTGWMNGYVSSDETPWAEYLTEIKEIKLENGITSIGEYAFSGCSNVVSVSIPNSVTCIYKHAFENCDSLRHIYIPNSVTTIKGIYEDYPFYLCSPKLTIYCEATEVPEGWDSSWYQVSARQNAHVQMGVLFDDFCFFSELGKDQSEVIIPAGITCVVSGAFTGDKYLESVVIPDTVKIIGESAFEGCTNLKEISIPESVSTIEESAFSGCTQLAKVDMPKNANYIGHNAFYGCEALEELILPEGIEMIGSMLVSGCTKLKYISIPNSVVKIHSWAFEGCESLQEIILPDGITEIDQNAFENCKKLNKINIPESLTRIPYYCFHNCYALKELYIPDNVISIDQRAFYYCSSLQNLYIPDSVTYIGDRAFYYACNQVWFEASAAHVEWNENWNIPNLEKEHIDATFGVTKEEYEFFTNLDAGDTSVVIPENIKTIPANAFYKVPDLISVYIPNSVTYVDENAFSSHYDYIIYCESESPLLYEGSIFADKCCDVSNLSGKAGRNITYSFDRTTNTLIYEGKGAFYDDFTFPAAYDVVTVDMSNLEVETVPSFEGYKRLQNVIFSDSITTIGDKTFSGCENLKLSQLPATIKSIGACAFENCKALTRLYVPASVTTISGSTVEKSPFYGCNSSLVIYCENGGESSDVGSYWKMYSSSGELDVNYGYTTEEFAYWTSLDSETTEITIPDNVTKIPSDAFSGFTNLETVVIPEGVTIISTDAFYNCTSLKNVEIPKSVQIIGENCFYGCKSLGSIFIPKGVLAINASSKNYATFYGCDADLAIYTDAQNKNSYWGTYWNYYNSTNTLYVNYSFTREEYDYWRSLDRNVESLVLPDNIKRIPANAFSGCSDLTEIVLPNSVTVISDLAFAHCDNLEMITIYADDIAISDNAFDYSDKVTFVVVEGSTAEEYATNIGISTIKHTHALTILPGKQASCTVDGLTQGSYCTICKNEVDKQIAIPATGHSYGDWVVDEAATCTTAGTKYKVCDCDDKVIENISALGHKEVVDEAVAATCTEKGKTEGKHCSVCGEVTVAQKEVAALGHKEVVDEAVVATCTEKGKTEGKHCSVCGEVTVAQKEVAATGHSFGAWNTVTAATCEAEGTEERACACGVKETKAIAATGHAWDANFTVDKSATMQGPGSKSKHCANCDATTEVTKIKRIKSATIAALIFNGSNRTPNPIIKDFGGKQLKKGTDYTVVYKNKAGKKVVKPRVVGTYTAVVTFQGDYAGIKNVKFNINPKAVGPVKLSKKGKKQITVKWTKRTVQTTGYEVKYGLKGKTAGKTVKVKNFKKNTTTIKGLKAKKTYWVQVRSYKMVNGVKYNSAWTAKKTIKTK